MENKQRIIQIIKNDIQELKKITGLLYSSEIELILKNRIKNVWFLTPIKNVSLNYEAEDDLKTLITRFIYFEFSLKEVDKEINQIFTRK